MNCAEACVNGCILGPECPHLEYRQVAVKFIEETSMNKILEIAEESVRKKFRQVPQADMPNIASWPE